MLIGYSCNLNRCMFGLRWINRELLAEGITTYLAIYFLCFELEFSHGDADVVERWLER